MKTVLSILALMISVSAHAAATPVARPAARPVVRPAARPTAPVSAVSDAKDCGLIEGYHEAVIGQLGTGFFSEFGYETAGEVAAVYLTKRDSAFYVTGGYGGFEKMLANPLTRAAFHAALATYASVMEAPYRSLPRIPEVKLWIDNQNVAASSLLDNL